MIYLEEKIRFDGSTIDFPGLSELAKLRGIEPTHQENDFWETKDSENKDTIILVPGKDGEE